MRQHLPIILSKINQSAPISEIGARKKSNSAIMTPNVTQKEVSLSQIMPKLHWQTICYNKSRKHLNHERKR
jgi:hypothetical protein